MGDSVGGNRVLTRAITSVAVLATIWSCRSSRSDRSHQSSDTARHADTAPPIPAPQDSGKLIDSLLMMNNVSLGYNQREVERRLGDPLARDTSDSRETLGYLFITWHYPALDVEFADTNVAYLTCSAGPCTFAHTVSLGMSPTQVEALLGPPLPLSPDNFLPENTVKYVGRASDCGATLQYTDGKLSFIKLWCDYS
jgi:hypothetical protein